MTFRFGENRQFQVGVDTVQTIGVPEVLDEWTSIGGTENLKDRLYNLIMDYNGYVVGLELVADSKNYAFLTGIDTNTSNITNKTADVNLVFLDGTSAVVKVDMTKSRGDDGTVGGLLTWIQSLAAKGADGAYAVLNTWVTYTEGTNGVYTLAKVAPAININGKVRVAQSASTDPDPAIEIDKKHNSLAGTGTYANVYGNNDSIYLHAKLAAVRFKEGTSNYAIVINAADSVVTGIDNVDMTTYDETAVLALDSFTKAPVKDNVNASAISSGVYTLYNHKGYVIAAMVVGKDNSAKNNLYYVHSSDIAYEEYTSNVTKAADGKWTWVRKAIDWATGEEVSLTEVGDSLTYIDKNNWAKDDLVMVRFNANGEVIGESNITKNGGGDTDLKNFIDYLNKVEAKDHEFLLTLVIQDGAVRFAAIRDLLEDKHTSTPTGNVKVTFDSMDYPFTGSSCYPFWVDGKKVDPADIKEAGAGMYYFVVNAPAEITITNSLNVSFGEDKSTVTVGTDSDKGDVNATVSRGGRALTFDVAAGKNVTLASLVPAEDGGSSASSADTVTLTLAGTSLVGPGKVKVYANKNLVANADVTYGNTTDAYKVPKGASVEIQFATSIGTGGTTVNYLVGDVTVSITQDGGAAAYGDKITFTMPQTNFTLELDGSNLPLDGGGAADTAHVVKVYGVKATWTDVNGENPVVIDGTGASGKAQATVTGDDGKLTVNTIVSGASVAAGGLKVAGSTSATASGATVAASANAATAVFAEGAGVLAVDSDITLYAANKVIVKSGDGTNGIEVSYTVDGSDAQTFDGSTATGFFVPINAVATADKKGNKAYTGLIVNTGSDPAEVSSETGASYLALKGAPNLTLGATINIVGAYKVTLASDVTANVKTSNTVINNGDYVNESKNIYVTPDNTDNKAVVEYTGTTVPTYGEETTKASNSNSVALSGDMGFVALTRVAFDSSVDGGKIQTPSGTNGAPAVTICDPIANATSYGIANGTRIIITGKGGDSKTLAIKDKGGNAFTVDESQTANPPTGLFTVGTVGIIISQA